MKIRFLRISDVAVVISRLSCSRKHENISQCLHCALYTRGCSSITATNYSQQFHVVQVFSGASLAILLIANHFISRLCGARPFHPSYPVLAVPLSSSVTCPSVSPSHTYSIYKAHSKLLEKENPY